MNYSRESIPKFDELLKLVRKEQPISESGGILYKRDDLLEFPGLEVTGAKLVQYVELFNMLKEDGSLNGIEYIIVPTSVVSPQGTIISYIANSLGLKTKLVVGNSDKDIEQIKMRNPTIRKASEMGADVTVGSSLGFGAVLYSKADDIARELGNSLVISFEKMFDRYKEAIVGSLSKRVSNIPENLDTFVIQCGSGYQSAGVLLGLLNMKNRPKNIYVIQTAGYDRQNLIEKTLPFIHDLEYKFIIDETYKYAVKLKEYSMGGDFLLDARYESKAHEYMKKNIDITGSTLFWVIGNNNTATS